MSWNNGVYVRDGGESRCLDELAINQNVTAQTMDDDFNDMAQGINLCLPADGSKAVGGNIDFAGFNALNIGQITGSPSFTGDLSVAGNFSVDTLGVGGNTFIGGTLDLTSNNIVGAGVINAASVVVTGASSFSSDIDMLSNRILNVAEITGNTTFPGNPIVSGNLAVSGSFSADTLGVATTSSFGGDADFTGNRLLDVSEITGNTTFPGDPIFSGNVSTTGGFSANTLGVGSTSFFGDDINLTSSDIIDAGVIGCQTINASNGGTFSGNLEMSGNQISNVSQVNGNIDFAGAVKCNSGLNVTSGLFSALDGIRINSDAPAASTSTGNIGTITWDSNFLYIATDDDVWKRIALSSF